MNCFYDICVRLCKYVDPYNVDKKSEDSSSKESVGGLDRVGLPMLGWKRDTIDSSLPLLISLPVSDGKFGIDSLKSREWSGLSW